MNEQSLSIRTVSMLERGGPVLVIAAGCFLLYASRILVSTDFQSNLVVFAGIALVLLGSSLSAFIYLRGQRRTFDGARDEFTNIYNGIDKSEVEVIVRKAIKDIQGNGHKETFELSDAERREYLGHLKSLANEDTVVQLAAALNTRHLSITAEQLFDLKSELQRTKIRIEEEIAALSRRGNLNLIIGSVTTIVAVGLLGYIILTAETEIASYKDFLWHYMPRITISIFIQVFSFFFLRLYRNSLEDIKYFQNELTNVDAKYASLESALVIGDRDITSSVIRDISSTDRNSRLKQGESTVSLEKLKEENRGLKEMLTSAKELISTTKRD